MNFLAGGKNDEPTVQELNALLFDETIQVLSNFELNQMASLTYGELVCDSMFETFEKVFSQPMKFTPITVQKGLVICKHILVYGSEKCVNSAYGLGKFIEQLQKFNTVLMAQQKKGALAMLQRIKGGGVDKGGPVREAADQVAKLISNIHELQHIRNTSSDPGSLVPVGDKKAAFVTDDVRHYILKKRMEEQQRVRITSNLAKADGGFGGGYNAKDGRNVVGAAHGIDEMIKMAKKVKNKYSDEDEVNQAGFSEYQAPDDVAMLEQLAEQQREEKAMVEAAKADLLAEETKAASAQQMNLDLMSFGGPAHSVASPSLLGVPVNGMTPATASVQSANVDLLGIGSSSTQVAHDPFATAPTPQPPVNTDLLGVFAPSVSAPAPQSSASNDPFQFAAASQPTSAVNPLENGGMPSMPQQQPPPVPPTRDPGYGHSHSMGALPQPAPAQIASADPMSNPAFNKSHSMDAMPAPIMGQSSLGLGSDDPFKGLETLTISSAKCHVSNFQSSMAEHRILNSSSMPTTSLDHTAPTLGGPPNHSPPPSSAPPIIAPIEEIPPTIHSSGPVVAQVFGDAAAPAAPATANNSDDPWMMGGTMGSGLGIAPAPSAPPPPPP